MAHTLDTSLASAGTIANPRNISYTCGAGTTVLVLCLEVPGSAVLRSGGAPTYNGVAMTQAGTSQKAATSPEGSTEIWYMLNPPTGSSYTVSIPNAGGFAITPTLASFKASAGNISAFCAAGGGNGTSTNPSSNITTANNNCLIVGSIFSGATTWAPTARTIGGSAAVALHDRDEGSWGGGDCYILDAGTAGTKAVAWAFGTSDDWGMVSVAFNEIPASSRFGTAADSLKKLTCSATGTVAPPHVAGVNYEQSTSFMTSGSATLPLTLPTAVKAHSTLVLFLLYTDYNGFTPANSIVSSLGNTYNLVDYRFATNLAGFSLAIYVCKDSAAGSETATVTTINSASYQRAWLHEYSGADNTTPVITYAFAEGAGGVGAETLSCGTLVIPDSSGAIVAVGISNNGTDAAGSGYTLRQTVGTESSEDTTFKLAGTYSPTIHSLGQAYLTGSVALRAYGLVTDDFNRADGGLGANWTTAGTVAPVIRGNKVMAPQYSSENASALYNGTFDADQYAQGVLGGAGWAGVVVRGHGSGLSFRGYSLERYNTDLWGFYTHDDYGGDEVTGFNWYMASGSPTAGDTIRLEVSGQGSAIRMRAYVNGVICTNSINGLTYVDVSATAFSSEVYNSGNPGVYAYDDGSFIDNFEAGYLSSGTSITGTAAPSLQKITSSATGNVTLPAFTGTSAPSLKKITSSATGSRTVPAFTGTGTPNLKKVAASGVGTVALPAFTGTAAPSLRKLTVAATGSATVPAFTGTATSSLKKLAATATGSRTVPSFTGTATPSLKKLTATGTGSSVTGIAGTVVATLKKLTATATGSRTIPAINGSAATSLKKLAATASGTRTIPAITGTVTASLKKLTVSATGSQGVPVFTGSASASLKKLAANASGVRNLPAISGTAGASLKRLGLVATGTRTIPAINGTGTTSLPHITAQGLGTRIVPSFTGTVAATLDALKVDATGLYRVGVHIAITDITLNCKIGLGTSVMTPELMGHESTNPRITVGKITAKPKTSVGMVSIDYEH